MKMEQYTSEMVPLVFIPLGVYQKLKPLILYLKAYLMFIKYKIVIIFGLWIFKKVDSPLVYYK